MTDILDCSNPIDGNAVRRQGYAGVARYLSAIDGPKVLKSPERDNLLSAGCTIVLVYEDNTGDALGGSALGTENGQRAADQARGLSAPQGICIYMACDNPDATADQVRPYYQAAGWRLRPAGYRIGFYGPWAPARALLADGTVDRAWVVETWRSGDTGDLSPFHLMQRVRPSVNVGGVDCDEDAICNPDYGQWGTTAPAPSPPIEEESDVIATNIETARRAWVRRLFYAELGGNRPISVAEQEAWYQHLLAVDEDLCTAHMHDQQEAVNFRAKRGW